MYKVCIAFEGTVFQHLVFLENWARVINAKYALILKDFGITICIFGEQYCILAGTHEYQNFHLHSHVKPYCASIIYLKNTWKWSRWTGIEFYESRFEQKNSIDEDKKHKSNIDVVLIGSNTQGESVILFLESKFSEYLSHGKYDKISNVYDEVYNQLTADQQQPINGLEIVRGEDMWSISASPNRPQQYCQGIKQWFLIIREYRRALMVVQKI